MPPSSIQNLTERRVPQYLAIYLGAAWGLVQFVDFIGTRYALPGDWTDLALLAMALLLPSVVLYTYHHGRPGRDEWQRSEKVFIPVNLVILIIALSAVGAKSNLARMTKTVVVKDEKGHTINAVVPTDAYRKRVAMFDLDGAGSAKWLSLGLPLLVYQDLQQQQFVEAVPGVFMRDRLRQLGYQQGTDLPLPLKRDIAQEMHIPYFVGGTIEEANGKFSAHVQMYETSTAKIIADKTFTAPSAADLADQVSANMLKSLDVPQLTDAKPDMPVAELLSRNPTALRKYLEATTAIYEHDDWRGAKAAADEAVKLDPTFAAAHMTRYAVNLYTGQPQQAQKAIQAALDHSYRLPDRVQGMVKVSYYMAKQDYPKAYALCEMLGQLYPQDIEVQSQLLNIAQIRDDKDAMVATLKKMMSLDPSRAELMQQLARTYEAKGDFAEALKQYQSYATRFPQEPASFLRLGDLYRRTGELAQARAAYEKALLLRPENVEALTSIAVLERNTGDFAAADGHLQEAMQASKAPPDKKRVYDGMAGLYGFTGQIGKRIEVSELGMKEFAKFEPPASVLLQNFNLLADYARVAPDKAEQLLARLKKQLTPPFDMYYPLAELRVADALDDADREDKALVGVEQVIQRASFKMFNGVAARGHGRVSELRNDCATAVGFYQKSFNFDPTDIAIKADIGRCYRKLGRTSEAEKSLLEVVRVLPAYAPANAELALLYKQKGDAARAHQYAQRALLTWQNADVKYQLAMRTKADLAGI